MCYGFSTENISLNTEKGYTYAWVQNIGRMMPAPFVD